VPYTVAELMRRAAHSTATTAMRYQQATRDQDQAIATALSALAQPAMIVATSPNPAQDDRR
jgi:hypothetical protein